MNSAGNFVCLGTVWVAWGVYGVIQNVEYFHKNKTHETKLTPVESLPLGYKFGK